MMQKFSVKNHNRVNIFYFYFNIAIHGKTKGQGKQYHTMWKKEEEEEIANTELNLKAYLNPDVEPVMGHS